MRNGGRLSSTLVGRGRQQRFSAALSQLGWEGGMEGEGGGRAAGGVKRRLGD